jgi:hypothetical protein
MLRPIMLLGILAIVYGRDDFVNGDIHQEAAARWPSMPWSRFDLKGTKVRVAALKLKFARS